MLLDQEPIFDAPMEALTQESKMQEPTILIVIESNEVLRIQEHSKIQRTNETLKIEKPLKAQ